MKVALTGPEVLARCLARESPRKGWPLRHLGAPSPWMAADTSCGVVVDDHRDHHAVCVALGANPGLDLDGLHVQTGLSPERLIAALTELELTGRVARRSDHHFHLLG